MIRRSFLKQLAAVPLLAAAASATAGASAAKLKILMKSAWGSDDPTKAAFPFLHGDALSEAGHEVQIFLLGEAVSLMRKSVANGKLPARSGSVHKNTRVIAQRRPTALRTRCMTCSAISFARLAPLVRTLLMYDLSRRISSRRLRIGAKYSHSFSNSSFLKSP